MNCAEILCNVHSLSQVSILFHRDDAHHRVFVAIVRGTKTQLSPSPRPRSLFSLEEPADGAGAVFTSPYSSELPKKHPSKLSVGALQ